MKKIAGVVITLGLSVGALLSGCSSDSGSNNDTSYDKTALLTNVGEGIILPSLKTYSTGLTALEADIVTFTDNPDQASLTNVRSSFRDTYLKWQPVAYFDFGPASTELLLNGTNIFPTTTGQIDANITAGNYDLNSAGNNAAKGLPAIDYLLYGAGDDAQQLALYTSDGEAANRIKYLKDLVIDLKSRVEKVQSTWESGYATTFASNTGSDVGSSTGLMVNALNQVFERHVRDGKIGIPAGVRNIVSGSPEPGRVEALFAEDLSVELALEALTAMENVLIGKNSSGVDGEGLYDYMDAVGAKKNGTQLSKEIESTLANIKGKLNNVSGTWKEYVVDQQDDAQAIFDDMQELVIMLKVDMPAAFSVSIVYLDNDGD